MLGNDEEDLRVLPHMRSIFNEMPSGYWHIYTWEAKNIEESPLFHAIMKQQPPKNISKRLETLLTEIALDTYNILDCHYYGRVGIRVDKDDNPYVLELNPNAAIGTDDCIPMGAQLLGMDYGNFLEEIIRLAIKRYKDRPPYHHLQSSLL